MEANVEDVREQVKKLAVKAGIDDASIEKLYDKFAADLRKRGMAEDKIEINTLMRITSSLKKRFLGTSRIKSVKGFIMARGKAYDGSKNPRKKAKEYVEMYGLEKAITDGFANAAGEPLYNDFNWRIGKVIPDEDWKATGIAMLQMDSGVKMANVNFKGEGAIAPIELFKIGEIPVYKRAETENVADVTVSHAPTNFGTDYVDLNEYAEKITAAHGDRVVTNLADVRDFYNVHGSEFGSWCIVEGNVVKISTTSKTQSTMVEIDDASLMVTEDDVPTMTVFFPKETKIDFIEGALTATFIVSPYENNDGEIILSGLGYWVSPMDRAVEVEDAETGDVGETPW